MKAICKRVIGLLGIGFAAVLCAACLDGFQTQEQREQNGKVPVAISVDENTARTVFPQVSLADAASYKLFGGKNGAAETELAAFTTEGTSVSLEPGTWNFTLNAYTQDDEHILQGKVENQQISLTETNQVRFSLSALKSGIGAVRITLLFPESAGITRIIANDNDNSEQFIPSANGGFVYSKDDIPAGDYFISFSLYRGDVLRTVVSELVLVRNNLTSNKNIALIGEDLSRITYTVRFDSGGGSAVSNQTVDFNDTVIRPENPDRDGWTFDGWYSDSELSSLYNFSVPVIGNITLYAKWVVSDFIVTFISNGGTPLPDQVIPAGQKISPVTVTRTGYTFDGWYRENDTQWVFESYTVSANTTLYAQWTAYTYTVVYDKNHPNAYGFIPDSAHTYDVPEALSFNGDGEDARLRRNGWYFGGWSANSNGSGSRYANGQTVRNLTETDKDTVTLYAVWIGESIYIPASMINILGHGYDVTGRYADSQQVKGAVLDLDRLNQNRKVEKDPNVKRSTFTTISGESIASYQSELSDKTSIAASGGGWGMSFSAEVGESFNHQHMASSDYAFATVRSLIIKDGYYINSLYRLEDYFTEEFVYDLVNMSRDRLIERYGTHVILGGNVGARADYNLSVRKISQSASSQIEAYAKAKAAAGYFGFNAQLSAETNYQAVYGSSFSSTD